jgi:hypothetical protein|tara:strand:- start:66 stop:257 length:192 start_codon:yes stop_codon:yes gene_type:complete
MGKIYRYHLLDKSSGEYIEKNIPELDQAQSMQNFLLDQNIHTTIEEEHLPQMNGKLGRDPDLH